MDDLGFKKFCDCADAAGLNVHSIRSRILTISKHLTEMQELCSEQEHKHIKRHIITVIADMSHGLERFPAKSINALSGASYILSAVFPQLSSLRSAAPHILGLVSSIFEYFDADDENTLVEAITHCFEDFFKSVKDAYVYEHMKSVRDIIIHRKFFVSALDSEMMTDAEIGVLCQVIPSSEQIPVFRTLEIRISRLLPSVLSTKDDLTVLLAYVRIYCQLLSLQLVLACNTYAVIKQNPNFSNLAGGYLTAMYEYIRTAKDLLATLPTHQNHMIMSSIGPVTWPVIHSFLPVLGIKTNQCADWLVNDPVYPPGAVLVGRSQRGVEYFIARIETPTEVLIGQIQGVTCKWIGNVSEGIRTKHIDKIKLEERMQNLQVDSDDHSESEDGLFKTVKTPSIKSNLEVDRKRETGTKYDDGVIYEEDEEEDGETEEDTEEESDESEEAVLDIAADVRKTTSPEEYRILCVTDPTMKATWRPNVTGVPEGVGALKAGRDTNGQPYFIGRMYIKESPVVGMVSGTNFLFVTDSHLDYESDGTRYEVLCLETL